MARPLVLVLLSLLAAPLAAQTLLVLPFENSAQDPRLDWLGLGLGELTIERLSGRSPVVFSREDWQAAMQRMGLPSSIHLSRATMLRIAEAMDAGFVVFGGYRLEEAGGGPQLVLSAQALRRQPPALSDPFAEAGAPEDLVEIHARLVWRILRFVEGDSVPARNDFVRDLPVIRREVFDSYARGLAATDARQQLRHLREAARADPAWTLPSFALGRAHFEQGDCATALIWLSRVPPAHARGAEAAFFAGVCHLERNDAARAESAFSSLAAQGPVAEAWNNLGVALARRKDWTGAAARWRRAAEIEPGEPDYHFNLALAALQTGDPAAAVSPLHEVLMRRPADIEARALLVLALEESGREEDAEAEREAAESLPELQPEMVPEMLRIKQQLNTLALRQRVPPALPRRSGSGGGSLGAGPHCAAERAVIGGLR